MADTDGGGMKRNQILVGDVLEKLGAIPDETFHCVVTSPPFWGLREYAWVGGDPKCQHARTDDGGCRCGAEYIEGMMGLEKTPEEYVARMVEVFREVRRVLRDDGTLFLNLGDSYYGSGKGLYGDGTSHGTEGAKQQTNVGSVGVQRAVSCDISGKEPEDYQGRDCLCESLCDVCRKAYLIGKSHSGNLPFPKQSALSSLPIHEHKESGNDHSPTLDSSSPVDHNEGASQDSVNLSNHADGPPLSSQESRLGVSSLQHQASYHQSDNSSSCPLCGRSLASDARKSVHKSACICGTGENDRPFDYRKSDISFLRKTYPHYTITSPASQTLKPKDLVGIPWMLAFALRADGYWLRQEIIWEKPNPMPESVTDRCTKAHEQLFLLTKRAHYFYDQEAIKESAVYPNDKRRPLGSEGAWKMDGRDRGDNGGGKPYDHDTKKRNKRSVWKIPTRGYKGAHFAVFPEKLVEPCILAGCPPGGIVLDPFGGAGTTGVVAKKLGRSFTLIELNPEYAELARKRLAEEIKQGKLAL